MKTAPSQGNNHLTEPLLSASAAATEKGSNRSGVPMNSPTEEDHHDSSSPTGEPLPLDNNHNNNNNAAADDDAIVEFTTAEAEQEELSWFQCPLQLMAMLSNFSTSYNVVNIGLVLPMLEQLLPETTSGNSASCASSLLAGMMVGQIVGGYLGDSPVLGRLGALFIVMTVQVVASIASALLYTQHPHFYMHLAVVRFLLGVGAGGVYPLAAVLSAEQGLNNKQTQQQPQQQQQRVGDVNATSIRIYDNRSNTVNAESDQAKQAHRVVLTFSTQGIGFITVPLVAVSILYLTSNLEIVWRVILALGCLPGMVLMIFQWYIYRKDSHVPIPLDDGDYLEDALAVNAAVDNTTSDTNEEQDDDNNNNNNNNNTHNDNDVHPISRTIDEENLHNDDLLLQDMQRMEADLREAPPTSRWAAIRKEPDLFSKLLGSAGTWFLFDVLFYGNTLFQPIVIEAAFGGSTKHATSLDPVSGLREMAVNTLILTSIALPGYFVAGLVIGKKVLCIFQSPKFVMLQGFCVMSALYLAIGLNWSGLKHTPSLLVLLYGLTFFFANYGPNTTTFILPSLIFSPDCRSTLNGVSAAAGKLGALTGAALFEPFADKFGNAHVMLICSAIGFMAFLLTYKFVHLHPSSRLIN